MMHQPSLDEIAKICIPVIILPKFRDIHAVNVVTHEFLHVMCGDIAVLIQGFSGNGFNHSQRRELVWSDILYEGDLWRIVKFWLKRRRENTQRT